VADAHIQDVGPGARCRVPSLKFAQVVLQTVEALLPEPPVVADPLGSLLETISPEAAQVLASLSVLFDEPRPFKIGNMF